MKALEIFTSHQGEGRYTGTLMTFIRFKVCKRPFSSNFCPMCDTLFKMKNCMEMAFDPMDLLHTLRRTHYNICFTGGEPTIYIDDIKTIIEEHKSGFLDNENSCIHFETNGFNIKGIPELMIELDIPKEKYFIAYSPKFFNEKELKKNLDFLTLNQTMFHRRYIIKLVVGEESVDLVDKYLSEVPPRLVPLVYLMPEGVNKYQIGKNMVYVGELSKKYDVNISDRLHVIHSFM
jgi:organic radical activating enzyme